MLSSFEPQAVLFHIGPWAVYWYGLLVTLAALAGLLITIRLAKTMEIKKSDLYDLFFYLLIFGFVGARLYEVLFVDFNFYWHNPLNVLFVWNGGLAIHGGIVAGLVVCVVWAKKRKINFWQLVDLLAPGLILGQAIGRWGNFFNQELFGRPTQLPWKIYIAPAFRPDEFLNFDYFHPAFLYESLLNLFLFFVLYRLFKSRRRTDGFIFWIYIISYSVIRFFLEFIRLDPAPVVWGLRWPQLVSLLIILAATIIIISRRRGKLTNLAD